MSDYCRARIWASGDTDACGNETVAGDYCKECLPRHIEYLREDRDKLAEKLQKILDELLILEAYKG